MHIQVTIDDTEASKDYNQIRASTALDRKPLKF